MPKNSSDQTVDGAKIAAAILERLPQDVQDRIFSSIQKRNPEAASKIETALVNFSQINSLPDVILQDAIRQIDQSDLACALSSTDETTKQRLISLMSQRKQKLVLSEINFLSVSNPKEIKMAQRRVLRKVKEIYLGRQNNLAGNRHVLA